MHVVFIMSWSQATRRQGMSAIRKALHFLPNLMVTCLSTYLPASHLAIGLKVLTPKATSLQPMALLCSPNLYNPILTFFFFDHCCH